MASSSANLVEAAERAARIAVGVSAIVGVGIILAGIQRASQHQKGRTVGFVPGYQRDMKKLLPFSLLGLALMYRLRGPLPLRLGRTARVAALAVGVPAYAVGLALMLWGRKTLGEMYNVSSGMGVELFADHKLVTSGPYRYVRHPMYVGGQLAEIGALLIFRTWAALLIALSAPALVLRARREEEALAAEFGAAWEAYRRRVPGWAPRWR